MSKQSLPVVTIYTDGACDPNPGPGGWAAILLWPGESPRELSGCSPQTTNNRMELQAVVEALRALARPHRVTVRTDSQYVATGALQRQGGNHGGRSGKAPKNPDLWRDLVTAAVGHELVWEWVKGHHGDPYNERADELARNSIPEEPLPLDDPNAIHLFTAACCLDPASGPAGWAVALRYREHRKTLSGAEANASANRMHLRAAIEGLQALKKPFPVHLYTTSDYLRADATRWIADWQRQGWQTRDGKPVSHRDLWEELLTASEPYAVDYHLAGEEHCPEVAGLARIAARRLAHSAVSA